MIDDQDVKLVGVRKLLELGQRHEFVDAGQHTHLVADAPLQALAAHDAVDVGPHVTPLLVDHGHGFELGGPEVGGDGRWQGTHRLIEGPGQAVRGIDRVDQRPLAALGRTNSKCGR